MKRELRVFPGLPELSRALAAEITELIVARLPQGAAFTIALSGGDTPRELGRALTSEGGERIDWARVHFFWGDERYVPQDDPRSNFRMARETLLAHVPVPASNIHPMPTALPDPNDAARIYEAELRRRFSSTWPEFDLVLLGLGADGHTASLFPGSPDLAEQHRCVIAVRAPVEPVVRLTLTLPVFNHARCVCFLVAGGEKAGALARVFSDADGPDCVPAARVRPLHGDLVFWADSAAAARIAIPPPRG